MKIKKIVAAVLTMVATVSLHAVTGDIVSIYPINTAEHSFPNQNNPVRVGQEVRFGISLLNYDWNPSVTDADVNPWRIAYTPGMGVGTPEVDAVLFPPSIGIFVSGTLRQAKIIEVRPNNDSVALARCRTELICSYTAQGGDIALPVTLANSDREDVQDAATSYEYFFNYSYMWRLTDAKTGLATATLAYMDVSTLPSAAKNGNEKTDYSLTQAGLYIQTIDFDERYVNTDEQIWRNIYEGMTETTTTAPSITIPGGKNDSAETISLYVWSDNTNAVSIVGAQWYDSTNDTKILSRMIQVAPGSSEVTFSLKGVSQTAGDAKIYLSAYPAPQMSARVPDLVLTNFVTRTVRCVEPPATTLMVRSQSTDARIYANSDYLQAVDVLDVYLTRSVDEDVEVTITPSVFGNPELKMEDYVRFNTVMSRVTSISALTSTATVTIPRGTYGRESAVKVYVYALRADSNTSGGKTVDFTPSISDAQKVSTGMTTTDQFSAAGVELIARAPMITAPEMDAEYEATANVERDLEISVADTYADINLTTSKENPQSGYKIEIKYRDSDSWKELPGEYYNNGGVLKTADGKLPKAIWTTSGEHTTSIRVTEPINSSVSPVVKIKVKVAAPRTVMVTTESTEVSEGDAVKFTITLSAQNDSGKTIYAFLRATPDSTAKAGKFKALGVPFLITSDLLQEPAPAEPGEPEPEKPWKVLRGLPINADNSEAVGSVLMLDGENPKTGGATYNFSVVLCESEEYDKNKIISTYSSNYRQISVLNVDPSVVRIEMGDADGKNFEEPNDDGEFENACLIGKKVSFKAIVDDPGEFDITTTEEGNEFQVRWSATREGGGGSISSQTISGDPDSTGKEWGVTFNRSGTYIIKAQVKDKDMRDWSKETFSARVTVVDKPILEIVLPGDGHVSETVTGRDAEIAFSLGGYYNSDKAMVMKITVTKPGTETANNRGVLELDSTYKKAPAGYTDQEGEGVYFLSFNSPTARQSISIDKIDGTPLTLSPGFTIKAEIINQEMSDDGINKWCEYYTTKTARLSVENVEPVVSVSAVNDVDANGKVIPWEDLRPIQWAIIRDVDGDYTGTWSDGRSVGIKVSFSGCDNAEADYPKYVTSSIEGTSGKFTPNFGNAQGVQTVTLTIEDKDNGIQSWTYKYDIPAAKYLTTFPNGPTGTTKANKYNSLERGSGHIYVTGATPTKFDAFVGTWNCGVSGSAYYYAFGYKANAEDNGTLNDNKDVAIDTKGNNATPMVAMTTGCYVNESEYDSYRYLWIKTPASKDGNAETEFIIDPETPKSKLILDEVKLPEEPNEKTGVYPLTTVEAVFSREFMESDNVGDINLDGVPDVFAVRVWGAGSLINLVYGTEDFESDLKDLANTNPDGDYLPGVWDWNDGVNHPKYNNSSYAPIGHPFYTVSELRGFHEGLNATDVTTSDADFSENEEAAYKVWFSANEGRDWEEADGFDLSKWSPEPSGSKPRLDPTLEDTDGDNMPDGWEYYFWYSAHVLAPAGDLEPREGQTFVFERFDESRYIYGTEIPAAEVEERFNPCTKLDTSAKDFEADFDNDGLTDYEELLIGTNPCHWDTDGDHMPDGWEVFRCLNPLGKDQDGNQDGDFMAYWTSEMLFARADGVDANGNDMFSVIMQELREGLDVITEYTYDDKGGITGGVATFLRDVEASVIRVAAKAVDEDGTKVPYMYGRAGDGEYYRRMAAYARRGTAKFAAGDTIEMQVGENAFILIHDQVLSAFGFDPRTAWMMTKNGYVSDRWDPGFNKKLNPLDATGIAVNTKAYSNYDEYLVMRYHLDFNIAYGQMFMGMLVDTKDESDAKSPWAKFTSFTTNPSVIMSPEDAAEFVVSNNTLSVSSASNIVNQAELSVSISEVFNQLDSENSISYNHGADTDEDGVPDGWELYTYRCPTSSTYANYDEDMDALSRVQEYAGVDTCDAYKNCPSIYENHTGIKLGWWNKFFPTDPDEPDTDRDGIPDGQEGDGWKAVFMNGGNTYAGVNFSFIYGSDEITDDGKTTCFVGGGMNPLTVDTDGDSLPDAWEMQFAGVPVKVTSAGLEYQQPSVSSAVDGDEKITVELDIPTAIADGVYAEGAYVVPDNADVVYIAGGMDATYAGDSFFDPTGVSSTDVRLKSSLYPEGPNRDVDFDHDGLQNAQEYTIQSVRHLRWDDCSTPLMGRDIYAVNEGWEQKFRGYVMMDQDPMGLAVNAAMSWIGESAINVVTKTNDFVVTWNYDNTVAVTNYVTQVVTNVLAGSGNIVLSKMSGATSMYPWNSTGYRNLGYLAPAPRAWDMANVNPLRSPYIMLPPANAGAYVSTDPRLADSDADGLDDFYEMFHGLNPILGTVIAGGGTLGTDIIADAYGVQGLFNAFYNEWTHSDYSRMSAFMGMAPSVNPPLTQVKGTTVVGTPALDPVMYPWAMGAQEVDADGDGLRNSEERLLANFASPLPSHTDPTPLWFTDTSAASSFTAQYYAMSELEMNQPYNPMVSATMAVLKGSTPGWNFSFEENEGYDTDNDWVKDGTEITSLIRSASDPNNALDPARRQALYLDGDNSLAMTRSSIFPVGNMGGDFLRQFTVEAWIKPEASGNGKEQTIIERSCAYIIDAINKENGAIRANFRIGLTADGRVFGLFDNSSSVESENADAQPGMSQMVTGRKVDNDKWWHVAFSYDGKQVRLYVNGVIYANEACSMIPANGILSIIQNPATTNAFVAGEFAYVPSAIFLGARPGKQKFGAVDLDLNGRAANPFANYREYYKGYVDEIRIWDGARTSAQILDNYTKAMSFQDVLDNRNAVFDAWHNGGTRNNLDGKPSLPAELVCHYAFNSLPGAVDAADVAKVPAGWTAAVLGQAKCAYDGDGHDATGGYDPTTLKSKAASGIEGDLLVGWWSRNKMKSRVYTDYHVVPWIVNTVSHLPMYDGSVVDSFLYNENLGGKYSLPTDHDITKFTFANGAIPYMGYIFNLERYRHQEELVIMANATNPSNFFPAVAFEFEMRSRMDGSSDLVPLGGAFAKRSVDMWDGAGPADVWESTEEDSDADGLPNWWEEHAHDNYLEGLPSDTQISLETAVNYHGTMLPAKYAYMLDLVHGMLPDGEYHPEFADVADANGNQLPDWWERLFHLENCSPDDDPDNDGLSNFAEYMLSFGDVADAHSPYGLSRGFPLLNPTLMRSQANQQVPDYFLPVPAELHEDSEGHFDASSYLGEIATDHDFMETWWERNYDNNYVNAYIYDPDLDADEDGWSNFAENRAYTWSGSFSADIIDRYIDGTTSAAAYPTPAIGLKLTYHGNQDVTGKGVVVRTSTGASKRMDSKFVVNAPADGGDNDTVRYLGGYYGSTVLRGFLNPGSITPVGCVFEYARMSSDGTYIWNYNAYQDSAYGVLSYGGAGEWKGVGTPQEYRQQKLLYPLIELDDSEISWTQFATIVSDADAHYGKILVTATTTDTGKINFRSGEFELDLDSVAVALGMSLDGTVFRARYSYRIGENWPQTIWVSEATAGRVKEGLNTIEVFVDIDGDGEFTPGEPYGMAKNVDVGWHKTAETAIELTDESAVISRTTIAAAGNAAAGENGGNGGNAVATGERTMQITVLREAINGLNETTDGQRVPQRKLLTKTVVLDDRPYITEADVLSADKFDLDSKWLVKDAARLGIEDIKTVTYSVSKVVELSDGTTDTELLAQFDKKFNPQRPRAVLNTAVEAQPIYSAQPVFRFTTSDDTAQAYRLQICTSPSAADRIYDSGIVALPGRTGYVDGIATFAVTPEVYVDCNISTKDSPVFADGTKYYWRVALLNAKYSTTEEASDWSEWGEFQMDVANKNRYPDMPTGYGNVAATVRYFGPAAGDLTGKVVVEVFDRADFSGAPLARKRLGDVAQLNDVTDLETINVTFRGVSPGNVYLRAYIDLNDNGKRDDWESWGYANYVGTDALSIYTPMRVVVENGVNKYPSAIIYIEDCDTNRNEVPDCMEDQFYTGVESGAASDADGDGLSNTEEDAYGTDPSVFDTDADGMPDGWEAVFADLDPTFNDADEAADNDVMAYAVVKRTAVSIEKDEDITVLLLAKGEKLPQVGDDATLYSYDATYMYGDIRGLGLKIEDSSVFAGATVVGVTENVDVALVHAQVYSEFGFNPLTATPTVSSNRWTEVHSKAFTALDKYLVVRWLEALGLANETEVNRLKQWAQFTVKPGEIDGNRNGIADGWELYVMFGPAGMPASLDAAAISPWKDAAYVRNAANTPDQGGLSILDEYDRGNQPSDPWQIDSDHDGVIDKHIFAYHLKGDQAGKDADGDGLSNYAEYLISEVFEIAKLDPDNAKTDGCVLDYFRKLGDLYLGEIFTDHDQVDDAWEAQHEKFNAAANRHFANRSVYDPQLDLDDDGWSNYAEARAGTDPKLTIVSGIDGYTLVEKPVPVVRLDVSYNGAQTLNGNLVVKAWSEKRDSAMKNRADAVWTSGRVVTVDITTPGGNATVTDTQSSEKYLGAKPKGRKTYYLTPGQVRKGSVKLFFKDQNFVWGDIVTVNGMQFFQPRMLGLVEDAQWYNQVIDKEGKLVTLGGIFTGSMEVGTIDYTTGKVEINFDSEAFTGIMLGSDETAEQKNGNNNNNNNNNNNRGAYQGIDFNNCYCKIQWQPATVEMLATGSYYLSDVDSGYEGLREGLNTFVAFMDLDNNGEYTAGEPFGVVRNVDVGWEGTSVAVELTDTNPIFARINLSTGDTDREVRYPNASGVLSVEEDETLDIEEQENDTAGTFRVRVIRRSVNGNVISATISGSTVFFPKVVLDKVFDFSQRAVMHEGDILDACGFDLDWETFASDTKADSFDLTNAVYAVVLGNANFSAQKLLSPTNCPGMLKKMIVRSFDANKYRAVPSPVSAGAEGEIFYGAKPFFKWSIGSQNTYPAFKLQILSGNTVVYDSGIQRAPVRDRNNCFSWTAPVSVGELGLKNNVEYTWKVSMYNAKFRTDSWSSAGKFRMMANAQQEINDHGYGSIDVAVKYAGPEVVLSKAANLSTAKGKVWVQAFTSADFSGTPVAANVAVDAEAIKSSTDALANVRLTGLAMNESYYIRAFIDMDGNGKLDDWESWGGAKEAVTLSTDLVKAPIVGLWIEDADTDGDWLPDAYEYAAAGFNKSWNEVKASKGFAGSGDILLTDELKAKLNPVSAIFDAGFSSGLPGASVSTFQNVDFAALLLGIAKSDISSIDAINEVVKMNVVPGTLRITSMTLDTTGKQVVLTVDADVANAAAGIVGGSWYAVTTADKEAVVTVKVYKKTSLAQAGWGDPVLELDNVKLGVDEREVKVNLGNSVDLSSGFFKVEVVQ